MKIIIFGANGFVGKFLVKKLIKENFSVICCDVTDTENMFENNFFKTDITDIDQIRKIPMATDDIVVNLAANQYHMKVPRKNRDLFFSLVNTVGTENLLKCMSEKNCKKMIMFTTDMVYGKPCYLPVDTKHPQNPFGPYGKSKVAAEEICKTYRQRGIDITIFRPRMIIGPGRLGILKKLFKLIDLNLPVPTIGNGKNCYQMISVFDCVSAILCAIKKECPNEEYNLGSANPPKIKDLLTNLIKKVGSKSCVMPSPGKLVKILLAFFSLCGFEIMYKEQYMIADENYILDISKTEKELEWQPAYSDSDMLVDAYRDYREKNK